MRQEEGIASSSCNCVLVSSAKSSLNTAPKCSILTTDNKTFSGEGSSPSQTQTLPPAGMGTPLSTSTPLKLKSGYALAYNLSITVNYPYTCATEATTRTTRGVQRHPQRRKIRHRNPRGGGGQNKEVRGGQSLKLLPPDVIF